MRILASRMGLEKRSYPITLCVSLKGEPMHPFSPPAELLIEGLFYACIGFCSHRPDTSETAVITNVVFQNTAGKVK